MKIKKIAGAAALALLLIGGQAVVANAGDKASGVVGAIAEGVAEVKGADGKTYMVAVEDIVAEDLATGDVVEYEVVEGAPVKVAKKAK